MMSTKSVREGNTKHSVDVNTAHKATKSQIVCRYMHLYAKFLFFSVIYAIFIILLEKKSEKFRLFLHF